VEIRSQFGVHVNGKNSRNKISISREQLNIYHSDTQCPVNITV